MPLLRERQTVHCRAERNTNRKLDMTEVVVCFGGMTRFGRVVGKQEIENLSR